MKKIRLLLAAFVAMIGLSAQAQSWVAPTITGEDPVSGSSYYLMNVGSGQFLAGGKAWYSWSTSAIVTDVSAAVRFTLTDTGNGWTVKRPDGRVVFISGTYSGKGEMHVDGIENARPNRFFDFIPQGNGLYRIHAVSSDATYGSGMEGYNTKFWGQSSSDPNSTVGVYATVNPDNGYNCDWAFISDDGFAVFNARSTLYKWYLDAVAKGVSADAYEAVYTNASATEAELKTAAESLKNDILALLLTTADNDHPIDITKYVLTNADISEGNQLQMPPGWETNYVSGQQATNIGCQHNSDYTNEAVTLHYFIEAWKPGATLGDGYLRQTVQNLPEGKFVLEADAIATWQNDDTRTITGAQLYITADGVTYKTDMSTKNGKPQHFSTEFLNTGEGDVIFGLRTVSANCNWLCADNFKVTFYGIDLSPYATLLAQAVAEAQAVEGTVPAGVYNALAAVVTANNKAWETSKEYTTAIAAIQNATDNAKAIQNAYAKYNALKAAALAIAENTNTVDADASANAASDGAAIEAAIVQLRAAFLAELPNLPVLAEGIDVTSVMVENASVRQGVEGWTISDVVRMDEYGTGPTTNYEETEFYHSNFRIYQTLALTPGTWEFGVTGFHRAGNHNTHFYAGEDQILIPGVESSVVNSMAEAQTYFNNGNGKVALKFLVETAADIEIGINNQDTETDRWTIFRDFTLKYYGAPDYTVYKDQWSQAVTDAEDALTTYADYDSFTATEKSTLEGAKANAPAVDEKKAGYITKINALTDATAAYKALSKKYESAKAAIAKANAIKEAHNFASAEAIATFGNAIKAVSDKYDDGTLTPEEAAAAGATLGTAVTAHHAGNNTPAAVYLRDGFDLGEEFADDPSLHVNTWSIEGDSDGSNFSVPFYEYWIADTSNLPESTLTSATLTGLDNGLYEISVWVRVRAKNEVTAGEATGITMDVNGGGEGDYAAVDVTEGAQIGESQFQIETYTAQNLVKDGNLTLNFNIAAENNISWLSFKNVKYTKVRDLTPEEAFTPATAEDYQALAEAIAAKKIGFDEGEYAPYNNIEAIAVLKAAQAIDPKDEYSQEIVQTATQAILDATWTVNETEVNAIFDGSFQHDYSGQTGNVNPIGWQRVKGAAADGYNVRYMGGANAGLAATSSGKALFTKQSAYYGYTTDYNMPLKAETYYKVSFIYGGWGDCKRDGYVSMAAPDGSDVALSTTDLPVDATDADSNPESWKRYEAIFKTGEAGDYVLGLRKKNYDTNGQSQYVYGDIQIMRATAIDLKAALQAEIEAAQSLNTEVNVGEEPFQIPSFNAEFMKGLIQGAQEALDNDELTTEQIIAFTDNLKAMANSYKDVQLNVPSEKQLFNVILTYDGWDYDNKAITFLANAREDGGLYNIQYKAEANRNLAQAFTFTHVEGNNYKMSQIDADNKVRYLCTGQPYGGNASQIRTTTNAEDAMLVTVIPTAKEGVWNLKNVAANQFIGSQDAGVYTVNSHIDFKLVKTSKPEVTISLGEGEWGTVMLPFAVAGLPGGVTAYTCAETNGDMLVLKEVTELAPNKPYILKGEWNETLIGDAQGTAISNTEGLLTGVYADTEIAATNHYFLDTKDNRAGFYGAEEAVQVSANTVYLTQESAEPVFFFEGIPTSIGGVKVASEKLSIYDLSGRKVEKMVKGVYIVNGKKVSVK